MVPNDFHVRPMHFYRTFMYEDVIANIISSDIYN